MARHAPIRARFCEQHGFLALELLVTAALSTAVLFATVGMFALGSRGKDRTSDRAEAVVELKGGGERFSRDLRQASWLQIFDGGQRLRLSKCGSATATDCSRTSSEADVIFYDCSTGGRCTRTVESGPHQGQVSTVVGLHGRVLHTGPAAVSFAPSDCTSTGCEWSGSPTDPAPYIGVRLSVSVDGFATPITFKDGLALRNMKGTL